MITVTTQHHMQTRMTTYPILFLNQLGRSFIRFLHELGVLASFTCKSSILIFQYPFQGAKVIQQTFFIGAKSVSVILLVAVFTGMVLGLQGYHTLVKFGAEGLLGAAVALSLIRELGPVLTAIMIIARAGSSMAAEIGIMRISEQIDALDTMDINPLRFLVSPRIAASLISFPLLTAIFDTVGILGGWFSGVLLLHLNSGAYFYRMQSSLGMEDIAGGFIKAVVFGLVVSVVCCYQGYFTHLRPGGFGAKGVSLATTRGVVLSCVLVLVVDYVLTTFLL
jgi:phospholipid/cholesterol/gamma-HCH transport system permease protein